MLRSRFATVATNRPVDTKKESTDIDVVVLEGDALYLFECKHSVPPTGPHEMRDIWEDIEKGASQLQVAMKVLSDPERRQSYIAGWFPDARKRPVELRIIPCVLCSHRIFSGLQYQGIPIRDFASFALLTGDAVVGMGSSDENGEGVMYRFRLTSGAEFSTADLDDYLSTDAKYFKMFDPFMHPVSTFVRLGDMTLARETVAYEVELDRWIAHMNTIGCTRQPDERKKLRFPVPFDDALPDEAKS